MKLKNLVSSRLGMDKSCIEFIDKSTNERLTDTEKLIVNGNSLNIHKYHRSSKVMRNSQTVKEKEFIELFITFTKYSPGIVKN